MRVPTASSPYNPVPQVALRENALPKFSVDTPIEAFGGASAAANANVAKAVTVVSDELFQRSMALQQLNNETEAREADSKYMIEAGMLHANYSSLEGRDRVLAFPKYAQDLKDLRMRIRDGMSNPAAQRLYDGPSLQTMGRSIFSGAGAAASANKQWTMGTVKSQLELDIKAIEDEPANEAFFQNKLLRIEDSAKNLAAQQGLGPDSPQEKELLLKARSKAWSQRIIGLSRVAPFDAAKLLNDNKKFMTSDDYLRADNLVRTQSRAVGAANIANEVFDPEKKLVDIEAEAESKAKKLDPNDPLLVSSVIAAVRTKYNQRHYAARQEQLTAKQEIDGLIEAKNPQNMQEFLAIESADTAYERLSNSDKAALPGRISRFHAAREKFDNELNYTRLRGMAASDDPEAREAFLNLDPTKEQLSQPQIRSVMEIQRKMKAQTSGDPRVVKAMTYLRGAMGTQLEALDVYRRTDSNKEDYDQFIGALQSALDVWQENHAGKPATYKDIVDTIGPQIVRTRTEPRLLGLYNAQVPFFKQTVPDSFTAAARRQLGNISEEAIYKLYVKKQYMELYGKPPKAQDRVTVPISR